MSTFTEVPTVHEVFPTELLLDIFSLAISPTLKSNGRLNFSERCVPLRLGHVCSAWRSIIWSTPSFWSSIKLTFSPEHYAVQVCLLQEWLDRSKNSPLSICFFPGRAHHAPWKEHSPLEVINILTSHSSKWFHVEMDIPSSWYELFAGVQAPGRLPILQTLLLERDTGGRVKSQPIEIFHNATDLQTLHLYKIPLLVYLPTQSIFLSFCWDRLRHLRITTFSLTEFHAVITLCPNLLSCKITELQQLGGFIPRFPVTRASKLKNLTLLRCTPGSLMLTYALNWLRCPSLTTLHLSRAAGTVNEQFELQSLIRPWNCKLTSLYLGRLRIPEAALVQFLHEMPSLRRLSLVEIMGPGQEWEVDWYTLSQLLSSSLHFLPALDYWGIGEFPPDTQEMSISREALAAIKEFRSPDNFPARCPDEPFRVALGGVSEVRWAEDD